MGTGGPKIFSLAGMPTPTSVSNLGLLRQGVGEGEFFENSQTCELELEDQNGTRSPAKLVIDIDLVLAPYCPEMARNPSRWVIFRSIAPTRQGAPPNLTHVYFLFRPILRFRVHPLGGCHPLIGHCTL